MQHSKRKKLLVLLITHVASYQWYFISSCSAMLLVMLKGLNFELLPVNIGMGLSFRLHSVPGRIATPEIFKLYQRDCSTTVPPTRSSTTANNDCRNADSDYFCNQVVKFSLCHVYGNDCCASCANHWKSMEIPILLILREWCIIIWILILQVWYLYCIFMISR